MACSPTTSLRDVEADAVVFGSGAAGLRCVERLAAQGVRRVVLVTDRLGGGTSNLSGSDKQTYYKMGVAGDAADSPLAFARTLVAGGRCHGDHAYIEGALSTAAFFHLCEIGVPFPHDALGAYVGYKTDHDPLQRGTSAGPRTSHFMVQRLLERVRAQASVEIHPGRTLARFVADPGGRVHAAVTLDRDARPDDGPAALTVYRAPFFVLATGGPGALYAPSVYPVEQVGAHGVALRAGARACNLAEAQFGLASTRFRWNLSGTYQQVVPRYFSRDADGREYDFLRPWFSSARAMATAIFLKGYQWPFHVDHLDGDGSSRVDLAVAAESARGRTVFMDFTRNPAGDDGQPMSTTAADALAPEARDYLARSGAVQSTPLERLTHMNPDAVRLYAEQGIDLHEPLACAVCFQHQNGGLAVDAWWRTSLDGLYAIGETAGTHGVRPGGSALNAGQVGAMRAAEHIAHRLRKAESLPARRAEDDARVAATVQDLLDAAARGADGAVDATGNTDGAMAPRVLRDALQRRMMDAAGFVRRPGRAGRALEATTIETRRVAVAGQRLVQPGDWTRALENEHLLLTARAVLATAEALDRRDAGSRGGALFRIDDRDDGNSVARADEANAPDDGCAPSRSVSTPEGTMVFRPESPSSRTSIPTVRLTTPDDPTGPLAVTSEIPRPLPDGGSWYESVWADYRTGRVFDPAYSVSDND